MTINQIQRKYAVGILTNRFEVQQTIQVLEEADFPLNLVSIIARESQWTKNSQSLFDSSNYASQGANKGALTGVVLGGISGILVGTGVFAIPMVGPIMLAEAITTTLVTTLAGSSIGIVTGGILGSLIGLVIPKNRDNFSLQQWQYGDYLVMVEGTEEDLRYVNSILGKQGIEPWKIYKSLANSDFSAAETQTPQPQIIWRRKNEQDF